MRRMSKPSRRYGIERRDFLRYMAAVSAIPILPNLTSSQVVAAPRFQDTPFQFGVASGDPEPDGIVLWTRLAPHPLLPGGGMPAETVRVQWEVAVDEAFSSIVRRGEALATPQLGHSVHVEVDGLEPHRWW